MRDIFVSIIIPFYNTPIKLLKRCLKSILEQSFQEYEIILIDDGSNEAYKSELANCSSMDDRIKVYLNEHGGVSVARNMGIDLAKGKYVAFVDADDVIDENFLKNAVTVAKNYNLPDVIFGGMEYIPFRECNNTQFGNKTDVFLNAEIDIIKSGLMFIKDSKSKYRVLGTPCGRLYKLSIAKKVKFPIGVPLCEDQIFNRLFLIKSRKAIVVPELWYKYIQNNTSVTNTKVKKQRYEMMMPYWDELLKLDSIENYHNRDALRGYYIRLFYGMVGFYLGEPKRIKQIIEDAMLHPLVKLAIDELRLNSKIPIDRKIEWVVLKTGSRKLIRIIAKILFVRNFG